MALPKVWLFLTGLLMSFNGAAVELTLAYGATASPPFQLENSLHVPDPPGLAVDIIRHAARKLKIKVKFVRLPNKRVLHSLRLGKVDGAFIFSYRPERARFASFPTVNGKLDRSKRIGTIEYYLYSLEENQVSWETDGFHGLPGMIGANAGYSVVPLLREQGLEVVEVPRPQQLYQLLRRKRIVAFASQQYMADDFIARRSIKGVSKMGQPISRQDYFLILGHHFMQHSAELARELWIEIEDSRKGLMSQGMANNKPAQQSISQIR